MLHSLEKSTFRSSISIKSTPDKNSSDLNDLKIISWVIRFLTGCVHLDKRSDITGDQFAQQFSFWLNYMEGWHHRLNRRAAGRCDLHFLIFVALLHGEARLVSLQTCLVSKRKLKRMQRSTYREVQRRLFELWEAFNKKEKSLKQLFKDSVITN